MPRPGGVRTAANDRFIRVRCGPHARWTNARSKLRNRGTSDDIKVNGVAWALVAAVGFGFTQTMNRKSNQLVDAYRTAFGLLVAVETLLVGRAVLAGEFPLLAKAPLSAWLYFSTATLIHFAGGWTLLALSQQRIGVARTGSLISAAPLVGALLAVPVLGERLTWLTLAGVLLTVAGVAMVSTSSASRKTEAWRMPWFALTVAVLWGTTPQLIRLGLEGLDAPLLGLTIGLGTSLVVHAAALTAAGAWRRGPVPRRAIGWMGLGGLTGAVAIGAQWKSFDLTTVAIAITVQQLATIVVVALTPLMFREPLERINALLLGGAGAMLVGSAVVVLAG